MSKLVFSMDMPQTCQDCKMSYIKFPNDICPNRVCILADRDIDIEIPMKDFPDWCPISYDAGMSDEEYEEFMAAWSEILNRRRR